MPELFLCTFPHSILAGMIAPTSKIPWYRPTFRRGLFALLTFEMFLLLAEQYRWLGFFKGKEDSELKSITLFIGLTAVPVAGLLAVFWMLFMLGVRRRFQYRLRSLLLLMLLVGVVMSWVATERRWAKKQRDAADVIAILGGSVPWDSGYSHEGRFLSEVTRDNQEDNRGRPNGRRTDAR
ncbi:MAG: hypothetical protein ABSG53_18120 [Thermoguttaceae bacterium]|jgi:hypothetical protein